MLRLPLRQISVTQGFGLNFVDFYQKMGLSGHPGVDFRAFSGFTAYSAGAGKVTRAGAYSDGGLGVEVNLGNGYSTLHYHALETLVRAGDTVQAGQAVIKCDNTGKYTTSDHLHFELRKDGIKIDPTPYFTMAYDGTPIKNKDCYKSNAYHRYFRKDGRNYKIEVRVLGELIRYLKRMPTSDQINACVYGAWDREAVANPAMYNLYAFTTKGQYLKGERPFQEYGK
jgi:murein DD-endopeptidase MepM/ murein hydrolase activator NlpD